YSQRLRHVVGAKASQEICRLVEAGQPLSGTCPSQSLSFRVRRGTLYWRQRDEIYPHRRSQVQLMSIVAGRRQPLRDRNRPALQCMLSQLLRRQMPTGSRKLGSPFQRPLEHQLRTSRAKSHGLSRQREVIGWRQGRRAQLDQSKTGIQPPRYPAQQLLRREAVRRYQVAIRQTCRSNDGPVGCRKAVIRQTRRLHPCQRLALSAMGNAVEGGYLPDIQQHLLVRVVVTHLNQRPRHRHHDAQFFSQFTAERRLDRLIRLDLASRKLPQPSLMLVQWSLGNQDTVIRCTDDRGGDMDSLHTQVRYSALIFTYSCDRSVVQIVSLQLPRPSSMRMVISSRAITAAPCSSV